ncbi:MAG: ATP-binding protein, partial [Acidobacteriota bacterium]
YPEVVARRAARRPAWFGSYLTTILQRDIRDLANVEGLTALPRLLELLAARAATLVRFSEVSRSAGIPQTTLKRYMALFETTYLTREIRPWSANVSKRLVKTPKRMFVDTGLLGSLAGWTERRMAETLDLAGALLENFVTMELQKQAGWSRAKVRQFHFRTASGREVDLVLENEAGRLVGIEVKASASVRAADFRGLETLREVARERFYRGVVLYAGREALPFGKRLHAIPISALWRLGASSK